MDVCVDMYCVRVCKGVWVYCVRVCVLGDVVCIKLYRRS